MVSRVAKNPIKIPTGVEVNVAGQQITVKGKLGTLTRVIHRAVKVTKTDAELQTICANDSPGSNALAGTARAVLANMVQGVHTGFQRKLVMVGVGYRAKAEDKKLNLTVGLSHPVNIEMPEGITVETPSQTEIIVKGADKQRVSQVAANIREIRPPEPYKGKGIRYDNERVILKEAKKK
ncbi:50S ribosomal protein L6 [Coxiella burnetii]|uniref:Large ribosomal subunit protein uL6 n=1 Tax=Coxiella burnetii (strain CbuG_Q212) TaxID=434923 RepID=RL6_COXB2|nr:50S ribosomal protein L6 [Coxiella burnetii]B6J248.1 RecName: Full=Large ribosomal subunit protein uL6; AltName: Full=50S ribosomal protein L6 [Coxiella burnetii CbuG_Q212]ACJ19026.1 LSU ribosomal protein L6P [Coxiella burnetii CbuG_Q212]ATN67383.1 50S ribosomal protein L6 [Coxiella burnetii]OYK85567.1 50S ribosomal protein L6 [Coxiella burnetii]